MSCFRFEVYQELVTHLEVEADSESEARERIAKGDENVTQFDVTLGDVRIVLRSDGDD